MEKFLAKKQGRIDDAVAVLDAELKAAVEAFDKANGLAHTKFAETIKTIEDEQLVLLEKTDAKNKR